MHLTKHPGRLNRGRGQSIGPGVGGGQMELAAVVLEAMTREVEKHDVRRAAIGQQILHPLRDVPRGRIVQNIHVEPTKLWRPQDLGQRSRISGRRTQIPQRGIVVGVNRDSQRHSLAVHARRLSSMLRMNSAISWSCCLSDAPVSLIAASPTANSTLRPDAGDRLSHAVTVATTLATKSTLARSVTTNAPAVSASMPRAPA